LFATVAPKKRELLKDHTTSPSVSRALVGCALHVHRIPPHIRDVREPPLLPGEIGKVICISEKQKYFSFGGLPRQANQGSCREGSIEPFHLLDNSWRWPAKIRNQLISDCATTHL